MSVASWFGDRLPVTGHGLRELTNEPVPYHLKRWWFALGGTPAGYQRLRRTWRPGEEISIECDFGLKAHYQAGRDNRSWVAFKHGPLALAQEYEEGAELEALDLGDRRPEAGELIEAAGAAYRIRGTKIELKPYYLAGSAGRAVRTLFPVTD